MKEGIIIMNRTCTWWQRLLLGVGIITASAVAFSGSEASTPAHYDTAMVDLIGQLHDYAREEQPHFQLLANGGSPLFLTIDGNTTENVDKMLQNVDGQLVESVFYGFDMKDGKPTPADESKFFQTTLAVPQKAGLPVFVLDYIKGADQVKDVQEKCQAKGYIPLATPYRELDGIPPYTPPHINSNDIHGLSEVKNYLALLNPGKFSSSQNYLDSLRQSCYDLLIIDLYMENRMLTRSEVESLKQKPQGGRRLVFAYMSIGEAEDYRSYWQPDWAKKPPYWLEEPNEDWGGNYRVKYWTPEWKHLLYGSPESYLDKIIAAGFDGAFLDVVDVYQYFQDKQDN